MFLKYTWLFILLPALCALYAYSYQNNLANFLSESFDVIDVIYAKLSGKSFFAGDENVTEKVFTADELKKYRNLDDGLYIAILGKVFDVTEGAQYYAPGETYHEFTGRDGSAAFVTGQFDDEGLIDDVFALTLNQIKAIDEWAEFYSKKYVYKGKLAGRFYEKDGRPAADYYRLKEKLKLEEQERNEKESKKRMFPPCNVEWQVGYGTRVWCTNKSGGIERDWVGVPRMLYDFPGSTQYKCACINVDSKEYQEIKGNLREYKNCDSSETSCLINTDNETKN